ncbi:MAG: hypothetical protein GY841_11090, partial [FCB group bacterium]|nr:hypothetical protein [FCB group bacterium]
QHLIDTVKSLNVTLAASQISNRVAIVWAGPCEYKKDTPNEFNSQYTNDVYYVVSDNQGFEWANIGTPANPSLANMLDNTAIDGGRITTYAEDGEYKAYCDLSALFDSDDYLHVVWNCRHWSDNGTTLDDRNGAIFHWGEDDQVISPVVIADWDDGLAETNVWAADVCKMTISECDDKLYILYTQFGNKSNPSGDISIEGNVNSELYLTASNDDGLSWDKPQNLTNSETPGC